MAQNYNENLEMHLLSCLLKDGSLFPIVEDVLTKKAFGVASFGHVYQSIKDNVNADLYPDIITVSSDLERKNLLDSIVIPSKDLQGLDALRYIKELIVETDNLESYAYQIQEFHANRQLLSFVNKLYNDIEKGLRPIEILSYIDMETGKIAAYVGMQSKNIRSSKDVATSNMEQFERAFNGEDVYIPTGLNAWDDFFGGLYTRLYMIAAEQNEGKSSLVLNLLHNISIESPKKKDGFVRTKTHLFTFESSAEEIQNKLIQMRTGIPQIDIEKAKLKDNQLEQYKAALKEVGEAPITYDDSPEITLPLLRTKIRKAVADGAKVIFIDQLEQILLGSTGDNQPEHIKLNYITYRIKAFQREQNVPIVLVHQRKKSQTTSQGYEAVNKDPELNDLNQAGGKAPDAVLMVRTKTDPAFFIVKNRQSKKGKRSVKWDGSRIRFSDLDEMQFPSDYSQEELISND